MLLSSVLVFVTMRSLNKEDLTNPQHPRSSPGAESIAMTKQFGTFLAMVTLLLAAAIRPSIPSAVYFIVFLGASTWWACFKELDR